MNFEQKDFRLKDEVALEEVKISRRGYCRDGGMEIKKTKKEVTEQDTDCR
jgi:hypothetical protein